MWLCCEYLQCMHCQIDDVVFLICWCCALSSLMNGLFYACLSLFSTYFAVVSCFCNTVYYLCCHLYKSHSCLEKYKELYKQIDCIGVWVGLLSKTSAEKHSTMLNGNRESKWKRENGIWVWKRALEEKRVKTEIERELGRKLIKVLLLCSSGS